MTEKFSEIRKESQLKIPLISPDLSEKSRILTSVFVREIEQIPKRVLNFFKIDPKTGKKLTEEKRELAAQVYMHELDEGVQLLKQAGKKEEIRFFVEQNNKIHLTNLIVLLREWLKDPAVVNQPPIRAISNYKIRNNQIGQISSSFQKGKVVGFTSEGILYKNRNEDALFVDPNRGVLAVLDGVGGHGGGEIASGIGVDFLEYALKKGVPIEKAIEFANEAILQRTRSDPQLGGKTPMGTTLVACEIKGDQLKSIHSGDSKLLIIRNGKIIHETQDHTNGQELLRENLVDLETAHFLNHILSRSLGCDSIFANRDLEKTEVKLKSKDRVLLASDGITDNFFSKNFSLSELAKLASGGTLEEGIQKIVKTCQDRVQKGKLPDGLPAKADNMTLLLYEYQ